MCDLHDSHGLAPLEHDEWVLDTRFVRGFVGEVRTAMGSRPSAEEHAKLVGPRFAGLLTERTWLPERFQEDAPQSRMGGGIGQWLLFRAADRWLCLFSLVVPPGSMTPVHDHLAWGLVGLYAGRQDEGSSTRATADSSWCDSATTCPATTTPFFLLATTSTGCARPPR